MPMERREARSVAQGMSSPEVCEDGPYKGYARLHWIEAAARAKPGEKVHALMPPSQSGKISGVHSESWMGPKLPESTA